MTLPTPEQEPTPIPVGEPAVANGPAAVPAPGDPLPEQPVGTVEEEVVVEVTEEQLDTEDDKGYEPNTADEPDDVSERTSPPNADQPDADLPGGDSGEFDGASIDEDEPTGEAQPDEPMTREAPSGGQE